MYEVYFLMRNYSLKSKSDSYLLVIMFWVSYALLVYFTIHNLSSLALECSR